MLDCCRWISTRGARRLWGGCRDFTRCTTCATVRGEWGPFRYGQVADFPVDLVTAAVEFVRAQRPSSGVEVAWLEPDTLRLRGSQPAAELHLRVSVPERK